MEISDIHIPRLIIAAPMSGSGKTTIVAGLIGALVARGLCVAPFKAGPDYIDPSYHTLAAGRPCHNLDAWMLPPHLIGTVLARYAHDADIALIEGVMGLFDGYSGSDDTGSTAHIARLTNTPVLIVLDARSMARTAAALVKGLHDFDPRVRVVGVILNRVGSTKHRQMLTDAIESGVGIPVVGSLGREDTIQLPERHLGLVPTTEPGHWQEWVEQLRTLVAESVDLERVLELGGMTNPCNAATTRRGDEATNPGNEATRRRDDAATNLDNAATRRCARTRHVVASSPRRTVTSIVAVARDAAFSFHYQENLDMLSEAGAELVFFSPLHDHVLPPDTHALYLCGGFPELYAAELAANTALRAAIHRAAAADMPIYAECGGLMYLTESLCNQDGTRFPMVGVLPGQSAMTKRLTLGYRTIHANRTSWLWQHGETMRGHEFHYSIWENDRECIPACTILPDEWHTEARAEGAQVYNVIASYIHMHFFAYPVLAERFVGAAEAWRRGDML